MVDFTKPCQMNGKPVRILCTDRPSLAGLCVVAMDENGNVYYKRADGTGGVTPIVNVPVRETRFLNVYSERPLFYSKELADKMASASAISRSGVLAITFEDGKVISAELCK